MSAVANQPLCIVAACPNPAHDGVICDPCIWAVRADLRAVPDVKADLLVTFTRQDVGDRAPSGRNATEPPLLYRPEASDADRDLHATLAAWSEHFAKARGLTMRDVVPVRRGESLDDGGWLDPRGDWKDRPCLHPRADTLALARWLDAHLNDARTDLDGGHFVEEISVAVARARQATDRPGDRVYLGPCECQREEGDTRQVDLYGRPDAASASCWNCGLVWPIAERRDWLLQQSASVLITGEMATRALPRLLDYDLTPDLLRRMRNRQGLPVYPPAAGDPHRRDLYRVGDIVMAVAARRAAAAQRYAAAPPVEDLPPDLARLFAAARASAAQGQPLDAGVSTRPDGTACSG